MKIETKEQFDEFVDEIIPQQLFHVSKTDLNPSGERLDERILIELLYSNPGALKFKPLKWFNDVFIGE